MATAASLHEATGHTVVVAFHAGNLGAVTVALRARYHGGRIVVCADDDHLTPGNPGRAHAIEAARTVGGAVAVPDFGDDRPADATDFNDLARLRGLSAVLTAIETAAKPPPPVADDRDSNAAQSVWPDPEPLTAPIESQPYPVDALPPLLRDWERDRALACAAELAEYETAAASYDAKKAGLLESIKRKRRDAQDTADDDRALLDLRAMAPTPVSVPRLLYADATPEALAHALATGWPSAAVLSAEAGAVFGAHGMGYETILRNLALLNVLWDGGEISVDRRSKPSFRLRNRRLTFGVMIQPEALRGFIERAGALPRGSGFIARFLIAWPASTQGHRPYRRAPQAMPAVDVFNARVRALLDTPLTTDAQGGLAPTMLDLSPAAHAAWVHAYDHIERQLGGAGHYASIRDVAAKAAENIARLAALLHVLDHGPAGEIDESSVESASRIIDWHLHEARRLLADLDAPPELSAAIRFDAWLRDEALRTGDPRIASARIYQYGPGCVRDSKALRAALALLDERGRARVEQEGRHRFVVVNPALLAGVPAEA